MAYDEVLAERLRQVVGERSKLSERKMFGGLAFLVDGHMAVVASGQGGVMVRVDPEESEGLVASTPAEYAVMRGREMHGWLRVAAEHVSTKSELTKWANIGVDYARSLPRKK